MKPTVSDDVLVPLQANARVRADARLRANAFAAAVIAGLLAIGFFVADELWEASFACYAPEGGCEATGVPLPSVPAYFNHL